LAIRYVQILTKPHYIISILFCLWTITFNCQDNSGLVGKVYRHKEELRQLDNYSDAKATLIDKKSNDGFEYAIVWLSDNSTQKQILIFERIIRDRPSQAQPNYLIVDTLTLLFKSKSDWLSFCECYEDTVFRPEIIAHVKALDDEEYFTDIYSVWVADMSIGKFVPYGRSRKIKCLNQDFGIDCGDSE
jgi:hypothetical protein